MTWHNNTKTTTKPCQDCQILITIPTHQRHVIRCKPCQQRAKRQRDIAKSLTRKQ